MHRLIAAALSHSLAPSLAILLAGGLAAADLATLPVNSPEVVDPATLTFTPYERANPTVNVKAALKNKIEKNALKFGMIKLTDCAPIVVARELGFFAEEGLNVTIEVQPNWKAVNDRLVAGEIDGTHMLYGHPLGAAIGYGMPPTEIVVPYNICINGMGITISEPLFQELKAKDPSLAKSGYAIPVKADGIKAVAADRKTAGKPAPSMFMTFPAGSHNMTIRYWLAAGGVAPGFYDGLSDPKGQKDAEVTLTTNPPPQMASAMAAGNCEGFCVGEPWNMQVTVKDKTGRMVAPSQYVFDGSPDKVFCVTGDFARKNPNTVTAITKALIRAGIWLDANKENRKKAVEILACKDYIGAKAEILAESMLGSLVYGMENGPDRRSEPEFNVFSRRHAAFPYHSHAVWALTQFRRWGMIPENKPDAWYQDIAAKTFRADLYRTAYAKLVEEGKAPADGLPAEDSRSYPAEAFIDKIAFDPAKPNDYLTKFAIGLK
jgi:nitrate/nitrite transport system substrate-binding protein